ncbi:MAG TPA: hypothetical protein VIF62_09985 [Labilithrix sp.]
MIALAAEFPNDNPALHDGVIWVCLDPVGAPIAVRELPAAPEKLPPASEPEPLAIADPIAVEPPERRASPRAPAPELAVAELDEVAAKLAEVAARLEAVARSEAGSGVGADAHLVPHATVADAPKADAEPPATVEATPIRADAPKADAEPITADATPITTNALPMMAEASPMMAEAVEVAGEQVAERKPPRASGIIAIARDDDEGDEEPIVVEELEPVAEIAEEGAATASADDPFVQLCGIMTDVARAADASAVVAALPKLLVEGTLDPAVGAEALAALAEGGFTDADAPTAAFTATIGAWRAVLSGASDDLSACGGATLDEWAADVLSRLLGAPAKASAIRRELRSRGVAAFGLLEAA